ncbi:MAG: glycosyltransferase family 39 protein [Syntrophobacter sp.]
MKPYIILVLLCLFLYVPGLGSIPPIDRDEARFAQATTQMLESGDYVRISFQDEPRNKKPIGIYWLQAASVAIAGTLESRRIWPYRIPSLLGAVIAVLFLYALGRRLFDARTAFFGAALCAASTLLVIEAHLATTDAVLLATIMAAQWALSRYYIPAASTPVRPEISGTAPKCVSTETKQVNSTDPLPGTGAFLTFWAAQAIGILIKGPITPLVSLLTIGCLVAAERKVGWLRGLRPLKGLVIVAALVSPWLVAIAIATKGAFFQQALGEDLLSKVGSAQELHGFPPGFYLALLPVMLWPASFFIVPALARAWKKRTPAVKFCLSWIIPVWILFELIPTKLPHYVLPAYPPLCLLIAEALIACSAGGLAELRSKWVTLGASCCALVMVAAGFGICALPWFLEHRLDVICLVPAAAAVVSTVFFIANIAKNRFIHAAWVALIGTGIVLGAGLQWILPGIDSPWLSRTVAAEVHESARRKGVEPLLASGRYHEPSLVFLLGTRTHLTSPAETALFLRRHPNGFALVDSTDDELFRSTAGGLDIPVARVGAVRGFNYSLGKTMILRLYTGNAASP